MTFSVGDFLSLKGFWAFVAFIALILVNYGLTALIAYVLDDRKTRANRAYEEKKKAYSEVLAAMGEAIDAEGKLAKLWRQLVNGQEASVNIAISAPMAAWLSGGPAGTGNTILDGLGQNQKIQEIAKAKEALGTLGSLASRASDLEAESREASGKAALLGEQLLFFASWEVAQGFKEWQGVTALAAPGELPRDAAAARLVFGPVEDVLGSFLSVLERLEQEFKLLKPKLGQEKEEMPASEEAQRLEAVPGKSFLKGQGAFDAPKAAKLLAKSNKAYRELATSLDSIAGDLLESMSRIYRVIYVAQGQLEDILLRDDRRVAAKAVGEILERAFRKINRTIEEKGHEYPETKEALRGLLEALKDMRLAITDMKAIIGYTPLPGTDGILHDVLCADRDLREAGRESLYAPFVDDAIAYGDFGRSVESLVGFQALLMARGCSSQKDEAFIWRVCSAAMAARTGATEDERWKGARDVLVSFQNYYAMLKAVSMAPDDVLTIFGREAMTLLRLLGHRPTKALLLAQEALNDLVAWRYELLTKRMKDDLDRFMPRRSRLGQAFRKAAHFIFAPSVPVLCIVAALVLAATAYSCWSFQKMRAFSREEATLAAADSPDGAAEGELGRRYWTRGEYKKAAVWLGKAAERGQPSSQTRLGQAYACGLGVGRDYAKAAVLWEKAAAQGGAEAALRLGRAYQMGQGVAQNYGMAVKLYYAAAETGDDGGAQHELAILYENGLGLPRDEAVAQKYREEAEVMGYDPGKPSTAVCPAGRGK